MVVFDQCKTCKHFIQYYVIKGVSFRPAIEHCKNINITQKSRKFFNLVDNCEYWEEKTDTAEYRKKRSQEVIIEINERLNKIIKILELDKDNE